MRPIAKITIAPKTVGKIVKKEVQTVPHEETKACCQIETPLISCSPPSGPEALWAGGLLYIYSSIFFTKIQDYIPRITQQTNHYLPFPKSGSNLEKNPKLDA